MDVAFKPVHAFHCYHEHVVILFCFLPSGKKKVLACVFPFRVYTHFSFCLHHSLGRRQRLLTWSYRQGHQESERCDDVSGNSISQHRGEEQRSPRWVAWIWVPFSLCRLPDISEVLVPSLWNEEKDDSPLGMGEDQMRPCPEPPLWQGLSGKAGYQAPFYTLSQPPNPIFCANGSMQFQQLFCWGRRGWVIFLPELLWLSIKLCLASKDRLSERLMLEGPLLT